jgi:hypothetical protein
MERIKHNLTQILLSIKTILFLFGNKKAIGLSLILAVIPIAISLTLGAPPLLEYSVSDKETVTAYLCLITAFYPDTVCELVLPRGFWGPLLYDPGKTGSSAPMNPKWFTFKNWITYYYFAWYFIIWQLSLSPIFRFYSWLKNRLMTNKNLSKNG